jgi:predicted phage terminase large subunit-like protein
MQNPKPKEGLLFAKEDLHYYSSIDLKTDILDGKLAFIDVADTGTDAHAVVIGYLIGTKIYIHDVLYTTKGTDENIGMTAEILNKHLPEYCRIESNFGGGMYQQLLQPETNKMIGLLPIRATTNKHSRITQMAGFIKEYCYFRTDYEHGSDYHYYMKNLTEYLKNGKVQHDDAPDATEGLCSMIKSFHADLYA